MSDKNIHNFYFSDGKNTVLLYLLPTILVPTARKITKDHNGMKCQIKYSIKDSQNSFMTFKDSVAEIEEHIVMRQNEKKSNSAIYYYCRYPY